jgi:hypothetical protein
MTSFTASIENLFHAIWQILAGLAQSFVAVGTSILALGQNLVKATFEIFSAIFTAVVDLMSGFVGFVLGKYECCIYFTLDRPLMMLSQATFSSFLPSEPPTGSGQHRQPRARRKLQEEKRIR